MSWWETGCNVSSASPNLTLPTHQHPRQGHLNGHVVSLTCSGCCGLLLLFFQERKLLGKMLVLGQRPKWVSKQKQSSVFRPGVFLGSSEPAAIFFAGKTWWIPALALPGRRQDGSDSCLPPCSSKENCTWVFLQGLPLLCTLPIFLNPEEASSLPKFLSPHPAKWSKNTSTGRFSTTPTQPGYYPRCHKQPCTLFRWEGSLNPARDGRRKAGNAQALINRRLPGKGLMPLLFVRVRHGIRKWHWANAQRFKQAWQCWLTTDTIGMNRQVTTPAWVIKTGGEQMLSDVTFLTKSHFITCVQLGQHRQRNAKT